MHIVWFRNDLRVQDNPALSEAVKAAQNTDTTAHRAPANNNPTKDLAVASSHKNDSKADHAQGVVAIYMLEDNIGSACKWWLHNALLDLQQSLKNLNIPLLLLNPMETSDFLAKLLRLNPTHMYWNRRYADFEIAYDQKIKQALQDQGIHAQSFKGNVLFEPFEIKNKEGNHFKVFTPFWRHCMSTQTVAPPLPTPNPHHHNVSTSNQGTTLESLDLLPTRPNWAKPFESLWAPTEKDAHAVLESFLQEKLQGYKENRNRPDLHNTSKLSPYLRFGQISPRIIWNQTLEIAPESADRDVFLSEVGWREFSYHQLHHNQNFKTQALRPEFQKFPWRDDQKAFQKWHKGYTGLPIVDAGMRQLWQTGWLHNRVRMIVGSFLVKNMLLPWQWGEEWFWDTLIDADVASNPASWQWVAGCGADAAPYFRIFNPILQGEKFDPEGDYVKKYVPELRDVPKQYIHKPFEMKNPPQGYPPPIVDLKATRTRALQAFEAIKKNH